ncbi:MAG: ankyrin repeat domain-containing protein [Gammaproteobacteria bacterium]
MTARSLLFCAALSVAACGGGLDLTPDSFTRERADGKIPVSIELIRQEVRAELSGVPEGEAQVARWQSIEADYHACRLIMRKAKPAVEQVFADCMAQRGYVYMYRHDAEQLHNDIEFEMKKQHNARIAAERKAEEDRIAAEKKRQEEQNRIRRQKALDTALIAAVRNGYTAEEARLIAQGANPQVAENTRRRIAAEKKRRKEQERIHRQQELDRALILAVQSGDTAEEARLIAKGANPQVGNRERARLNARLQEEEKRRTALRQKEKTTALANAFYSEGNVDIAKIKRLINGGADVNIKDKYGQTPLHYAAWKGHTEAARILVKAMADIDAKSNKGGTPLDYAAGHGQTEIALVLIKAGADIDAKHNNGSTPLHTAAWKGHTEIVLALIKAGANVNTKDKEGSTPLYFAAWSGHAEIARALVRAGANIEAKGKFNRTLLHLAAYYGETKAARALIYAGANIEAKDEDGWTPLHIAAWQGKAEVARILIRAGAYTLATTNDGEYPIQIADRHKQWAVVKVLRGF